MLGNKITYYESCFCVILTCHHRRLIFCPRCSTGHQNAQCSRQLVQRRAERTAESQWEDEERTHCAELYVMGFNLIPSLILP